MPDERSIITRGVTISYDVQGAEGDPTVLLLMGLNLQLVWWRDALCDLLIARGLRLVRTDHRDVGRSSRFAGPGPTTWQYLRRTATPSYGLDDMADDAAAVVAAEAPDGAHVVGVSMGSLVAQELAIRHPVRSLTSIMGRPGDRRTGRSSPRTVLGSLRPGPADPVEARVWSHRRLSPQLHAAQDDEDVRAAHAESVRRSPDESGGGRQLAAILTERDRTAALGGVRVPALVVHGLADRVIRPDGGRATAAALPVADLLEIERMGHALPRAVWPQLVDAIAATVARS